MSAITILELIGLHYSEGSSDKVWGAALLQGADSQCTFTAVYGPRDGTMNGKPETYSEALGRKQFEAKLKEKLGKGYQPVDLHASTPGAPGRAMWNALVSFHPVLVGVQGAPTPTVATAAISASNKPRLVVSHVVHLDPAERARIMASPQWGMTEKVNGDRRTVEVLPDRSLISYNRRGLPKAPPQAAARLVEVGVPLMVDGEALPGGRYAIFDLLEWNGTNVRKRAYRERIRMLEIGLEELHLDMEPFSSPEDLFILRATTDAEEKRYLYDQLQQEGAEGVIFRNQDGPDVAGDTTRYVYKDKFLAEVDCFVFGHTVGREAGSLRMGVIRPSDGATIEVANVSGGLGGGSASKIRELARRAASGERPVFSVSFLLARTPGISLVEPRFSSGERTDKSAAECTTDQLVEVLGANRAPFIASAAPVR